MPRLSKSTIEERKSRLKGELVITFTFSCGICGAMKAFDSDETQFLWCNEFETPTPTNGEFILTQNHGYVCRKCIDNYGEAEVLA